MSPAAARSTSFTEEKRSRSCSSDFSMSSSVTSIGSTSTEISANSGRVISGRTSTSAVKVR